jgi:hypothetical protein
VNGVNKQFCHPEGSNLSLEEEAASFGRLKCPKPTRSRPRPRSTLIDWLYSPITGELEKRGFPSMLVRSSVSGSDTPMKIALQPLSKRFRT